MHELHTLVKNIAVVDDLTKNREGAVGAINEKLPGVVVHQFSSAREFLAALEGLVPKIDLVLSDMNMEDEDAGYRVVDAAWSWGIPATIVTAGMTNHDHRQVNGVFLRCPRATFLGSKSDPMIWEEILEVIFSGVPITNAILAALEVVKVAGKKTQPDLKCGRACATAMVI